jgi:hypothetical protein
VQSEGKYEKDWYYGLYENARQPNQQCAADPPDRIIRIDWLIAIFRQDLIRID